MGSRFMLLKAVIIIGTQLLGTSDAECSVDSMVSCMTPITQYIISDEGSALMSGLGPGSTSASIAKVSNDQLVRACVVATDVFPCMRDPLIECIAIMPGTGGELMAAMNRAVELGKSCHNEDFAVKARIVVDCTSRLTAESSKYMTCNSETSSMISSMSQGLGVFQPRAGFRTKDQINRHTSEILRKTCCSEERRYACSMGEVRRVCGSEAAGIFEDLHHTMSDLANCSAYNCETQPDSSSEEANSVTSGTSSSRDGSWLNTVLDAGFHRAVFGS